MGSDGQWVLIDSSGSLLRPVGYRSGAPDAKHHHRVRITWILRVVCQEFLVEPQDTIGR